MQKIDRYSFERQGKICLNLVNMDLMNIIRENLNQTEFME